MSNLRSLRHTSPGSVPRKFFDFLRNQDILIPRRFLDCFRIFHGRIPSIEPPSTPLSFGAKFAWTFIILMVVLVLEQIPIYGIIKAPDHPVLIQIRSYSYGAHGKLTEFGLAGIGLGTMLKFLLDTCDLLSSKKETKNDSELEESARIAVPFVCTLYVATIYTVMAPCFNFLPGEFIPVTVFLQLFGTGLFLLYFDEILSKGYGFFNSGIIPVLILAHRCRSIFWDALSPVAQDVGRGWEFHGTILNLFHLLWTWADKELAVYEAFFRRSQPSLLKMFLSISILLLIFYLKGVRVEIPLRSRINIGERGTIPIPLLVTCIEPLIWNYGSIGFLFSLTLLRHIFIPTTWKIILMFGTWTEGGSLGYVPTGGLIYWILPPVYFPECRDTRRLWVYSAYIIILCISTSRCAIDKEDHDFNPDKMTDDLLGPTGVTRAGKYNDKEADENLRQELHRVIPIASVLGGLVLGSICVLCDLLNLLGGGHSLLTFTLIIWSVYEMWKKENDLKEKRA